MIIRVPSRRHLLTAAVSPLPRPNSTLTRDLRLSKDEQSYVYELAGEASRRPRRRVVENVRPAMGRLLEQLTETPAIVLGRRMSILAWNASAAALFGGFGRYRAKHRNYVYLLFADPAIRTLHVDWTDAARTAVAALHMKTAQDPDAPELTDLVGELAVHHPEFRTWWAAHQVTSASYGVKHYRHPVVGDLTLDCDLWDSPDGSGQRLMVLTAEPGSPSHEALRILSSWTAQPAPAAEG